MDGPASFDDEVGGSNNRHTNPSYVPAPGEVHRDDHTRPKRSPWRNRRGNRDDRPTEKEPKEIRADLKRRMMREIYVIYVLQGVLMCVLIIPFLLASSIRAFIMGNHNSTMKVTTYNETVILTEFDNSGSAKAWLGVGCALFFILYVVFAGLFIGLDEWWEFRKKDDSGVRNVADPTSEQRATRLHILFLILLPFALAIVFAITSCIFQTTIILGLICLLFEAELTTIIITWIKQGSFNDCFMFWFPFLIMLFLGIVPDLVLSIVVFHINWSSPLISSILAMILHLYTSGSALFTIDEQVSGPKVVSVRQSVLHQVLAFWCYAPVLTCLGVLVCVSHFPD